MTEICPETDQEHSWGEDYTSGHDNGLCIEEVLDYKLNSNIPSLIEVDITVACYDCAETKHLGTRTYKLEEKENANN